MPPPPPMAVRRWHIVSPPIRPSASVHAHLWRPAAVAKLQAYGLGSCATGQTDERIALFQTVNTMNYR